MRHPVRLVFAMCVAEVLGMTAFATYPALLPRFRIEWGLSNTMAGWIGGVYFAGYVLAVGGLTAVTDRVDARRVYLGSMLLSALSAVGFGVAAHDAASAAWWRTLQGIGLAGTYMPGLKALTDLVPARLQSRTIAFYTSCFGIGSAMSFYLAGALTNAFGWRWAFVLAGGGPLLALVVIAVALPPVPPSRQAVTGRLWDFRPVLRNRAALGYMLAYAAHNVELFAFRTWVVAFLVYVLARHGQDAPPLGLEVTTIAALLNLASLPASVTGNEVAERLGRRRTLAVVMLASAGLASVLGFSAAWSVWAVLGLLVVYSFTVMADSATITAGAVAAARTHQRGTTMAVHSVLGFSGAAVGPLLFGAVLDVAGGGASLRGWGAAFLSMGVVVALGPLAVWSLRGRQS